VDSPTNNYHQVRLAGALAGIESLALLSKISSLKEPGFNMATAEVIASASSVAATVTDMMYVYTKSVRELPSYAVIDGIKNGADIVRGGFKLTAGLLAAFAGVITASSDWQKAEKNKDPFLRAILYTRSAHGWASFAFGSLAAYSYSGPLLTHLANKKGRSFLVFYGYSMLAERAEILSSRVLLLRVLAWVGWIGVVITIVDLSYSGYRWFVDYTATVRWLSRCTFRKVQTNKNFSTLKEELEEFKKAQHPQQDNT
jgi:hypothetical protein